MSDKIINAPDFLAAEKRVQKLAKNKAVTDNFAKISEALNIIKSFKESDDVLEIEYGTYNCTFTLYTYLLSFHSWDIDLWRQLMSLIEILNIQLVEDDRIMVEMTIQSVFDVPGL